MNSAERRAIALAALSGCHVRPPRASVPLRELTPQHEKRNQSGIEWRQCRKKTAYLTEARARHTAERILAERGVALRVYQCEWCHLFHLTRDLEKREYSGNIRRSPPSNHKTKRHVKTVQSRPR